MKRVLACICGWILLCGIQLTVWGNTPLYSKEYTVSQPSGETFRVQIPLAITIPDNTIPVGTIGYVNWKISDHTNSHTYSIRLAEDGYWYYINCCKIIVYPINNSQNTICVDSSEKWDDKYNDNTLYNQKREYSNTHKYLIDPLPDVTYDLGQILGAQYLPSQIEKETMAEMIAAERQRLGKEEPPMTGEEPVESVFSDPGPELFITVPVEETESQPAAVTEQPAETTSEPAQTEEAETQSAPETTTAREPSEPAVTAAAEEENTGRWTGPLLWGGGILVLIGLGAGGGVLLWRRKKKRGA